MMHILSYSASTPKNTTVAKPADDKRFNHRNQPGRKNQYKQNTQTERTAHESNCTKASHYSFPPYPAFLLITVYYNQINLLL